VKEKYSIITANTWNMDEVGNALGPCANQTVIGSQDTTYTYVAKPKDREWVTAIECISAAGRSLMPLIIFKGKYVQRQWFIPENTPQWTYTSSPNAFTSNDIGLQWLQDIFIPDTTQDLMPGQYRLLILDGHKSHTTIEFMMKCTANKIIPYYLIPHASHILQPLDLTVFSSLKRKYRAIINQHSYLDELAPIKKQSFLEQYQKARAQSMTVHNIQAGFTAAGIDPWCPRKPLSSPFLLQDTNQPPRKLQKTPQQQEIYTSTPKTSRQLPFVFAQFGTPNSTKRILFRKITTGFERLEFQLGIMNKDLATCNAQLFQYKSKYKKKTPVDPNKAFIDIEAIKSTEDRVAQAAVTLATLATATPVKSAPIAGYSASTPFEAIAAQLRSIATPR
jgi:hypothetical protein